jgi:tetratricopeptide (TPR) repeat protein
MWRLILNCSVLVAVLSLPTIATAQNTSVGGQIIAPDGTPWVDLSVVIENVDTGQIHELKTDKDGRYAQWGLLPGVYKITIHDKNNKSFTYSEIHMLRGTQENDVSMNFSRNIKTFHPDVQNETEGEVDGFNTVKEHFNAGLGTMYDAEELRRQLATAPVSSKGAIQEKLSSDYQTAIREFQLAQQAASPTDVKTQAMIWGQLGEAHDYAAHYDDAANAYQKAVALRPEGVFYQNLSKAQASAAVAQTDAKEMEQQLAEAGANCDKAATLDPATAAKCWKNIGILLSNKGDMKRAITPLQKTTQLDPVDSQAWFLLGKALLAMIETKQEGKVATAVFPPGTAEAFQRCIDADPNGPYASQAKEVLDGLAEVGDGKNTGVDKRKD